jgi:hypothetical protein
MSNLKECALFIAVLTLSIAASQAQTGVPPYQSFGGGPDIINLSTLNVHYSIPVFSRAGRGLPFNYALAYDSSIWSPSSGVWYPTANWGLHRDQAALVGYVGYSFNETTCRGQDGQGVRDTWRFGSYVDSAGTIHPIQPALTLYDDTCSGGGVSSATAVATDGSGIKVSVTWDPSATVTLPSGEKITPQLLSGVTFSGAGVQTDSNGNQITSSSASGTTTFTDTLGTTALTITGTAPSPVLYKYTAPSGAQASVTVTYVSKTVQTNFGCAGVSEYGPVSVSLADKITLPDGSYYQFGYEATPGDAHSPHYVTGRIASFRLPTGGTISYTYTGGDTNKGIMCADGSTAGLARTTPDTPGQAWSYVRSGVSSPHTTAITSPPDPFTGIADVTNIQFQGNYETQRDVYQGAASGTPLKTTYTCYNGNGVGSPSTCSTIAVATPFSRITRFTSLDGGTLAESDMTYDGYGNVTGTDSYDFGASTPTTKTTTVYGGTYNSSTDTCAVLTNNIVDQ